MSDPIKILGLKPGDTLKTAHKNRNALFLKLHPDKSTSDKDKYQVVYDAYEALLKNPGLLTAIKVTSSNIEQVIRVKLNVTIEDFYFKKVKEVTVTRKVFCRSCKGTGSASGEGGNCPHCNGIGKIESNILSLLGKSSTCPMCHGTGIRSDKICRTCGGIRYLQETQSLQFILEPINYHKKVAVLHNVGDQLDKVTFGTVAVMLNVLHDDFISIEEDYYVVYDKIFPIQKIIGDTNTIKIFGRPVTYQIKGSSTEAYTIDHISAGLSQQLRVKFVDIIPKLTRETVALYTKILEIEKSYEDDVFSIQF
jgi:DnaJ-class molecular chaperone